MEIAKGVKPERDDDWDRGDSGTIADPDIAGEGETVSYFQDSLQPDPRTDALQHWIYGS